MTSHFTFSALVALVALVPCHAIALSPLPGARTSIARPAQFSRRAAVRCSEDDDLVALLVDDDAFDDDDGGDLKPQAPPAPPAPPVLPDGEVVLETLEHGAKAMRVGVAGKELSFETGEIGRLASGTVVCKSGGTHVLSAACFERKDEVTPLDFTPLRVDYIERKSSVGRTAGGYIKRDGRPSDHETLVCRLIDRPLRPLLGNGWSLETQLTSYVLAADGEHLPDVMAICSASAALAVSQVPFAKPVAAVRVVLVGDELVVNPTKAEVAAGGGKLDLVVAGTAEAVLMIEGFADFLPEARVVDALEKGLAAVATIANAIAAWKAEVGQPPFLEGVLAPPADLGAALETWGVDAKVQAMLSGDEKKDREALLRDVQVSAQFGRNSRAIRAQFLRSPFEPPPPRRAARRPPLAVHRRRRRRGRSLEHLRRGGSEGGVQSAVLRRDAPPRPLDRRAPGRAVDDGGAAHHDPDVAAAAVGPRLGALHARRDAVPRDVHARRLE